MAETNTVEDSIDLNRTRKLLKGLLKPEAGFFGVVMVYGVAIGLLTLAVPIAVQTLINTIANIASVRAVTILAMVLFTTLFVSGVVSALRMRVMEYYERRIYTRLTADLGLRTILAPHSFFEGRKNNGITQRYFDIMILQKNVPNLMVDGFAFMLQMLVGVTLISFYHEALLAFNMVLLLVFYFIYKLWGNRAKRTAIELSHAKYSTAKWLSDIAAAHEFFKSSRHVDYAGKTTEKHIDHYVEKHSCHFVYTFYQSVAFLLLYALASAALLGLGGWLVVQGQLSIGQLVAAELVMSGIFFGLSRFSYYLKLYYELYGSADKIGKALVIPQEETNMAARHHDEDDGCLECKDLLLSHLDRKCYLNLHIEQGAKVYVMTESSWIQRQFIHLLKLFREPKQGWIKLGSLEFSDYDTFELRQMISMVDRSLIVECTIQDYLRMSAPQATIAQMNQALIMVGLDRVIGNLPDGIETRMTPLGTPLLPAELLLLKLAAAIIAKPKVVILNQHFDAIPHEERMRLLEVIADLPFTVLYFTTHPEDSCFDGVIELGKDCQTPLVAKITNSRKSEQE